MYEISIDYQIENLYDIVATYLQLHFTVSFVIWIELLKRMKILMF